MNSSAVLPAPLLTSDQGEVRLETSCVRILLVDDFEPFRNLVSTVLLKPPRFQIVGEAADGLEGVRRANELKPDLILLDMDLPRLNGLEVARRIRQESPDSIILLVSACAFPELARAALDVGAAGYVAKFEVADDLLPAIDAVLRGKQFVSPKIVGSGMSEDSLA